MAKHPRDVIVKVFRKEIKGMLNESDRKMMDSIKRNEREKYKRMRMKNIKRKNGKEKKVKRMRRK